MSVKEDAEKLEQVFDNLTQSIQDASKTSNKLRDTFLELSKSGTAAGNAWTVISRLTSGTGFWRIQNRVRAISNFLQFQDKRAEAIAESENKAIERLAKQVKLKKEIDGAQRLLDKVIIGTATAEERVTFYKSEQYRYLEQTMGGTKALQEMTGRLQYASEQLSKTDAITLQNRARNFQKELESRQSLLNIITNGRKVDAASSDLQLKRFKKLSKEQQQSYMQYIDFSEKRKRYEDDQIKAQTELLNITGTLATAEDELARKKSVHQSKIDLIDKELKKEDGETNASKVEIRRLNEKRDEMKRKFEEENKPLKEEIEKQKKEKEFLQKETKRLGEEFDASEQNAKDAKAKLKKDNIDVSMKDGGTIENDPQNQNRGFREFLKNRIPGGKKIDKVITMAMAFYALNKAEKIEKLRNLVRGSLRLITRFLRGVFIWLPLLIFGLMALKQTGLFDVIINFAKTAVRVGYNIFQGILEIGVIIGEIFGNALNFIDALFNGDSGDAWNALSTLFMSVLDLVGKLFEFIFIDVLWGLISGFFVGLFGKYFAEADSKFSAIVKAISDIGLVVLAIKVALLLLPTSLPLAIAGAIVTALIGGGIRDLLFNLVGMADGGLVTKSSPYLVGERGPEIVNLKAGDYVTPNHKIPTGSTTNITVNVNGRLGASDSELNDIANKLSRKISLEMNRTNPTGVYR